MCFVNEKMSLADEVDSFSVGENVGGNPVPVKQHIELRKEHINYRGYSNLHQLRLYKALKKQSEKGR